MTKAKVLEKVGFKLMFKNLRFSHERMSSGSLFQSSGAETENALDPQVLRLKLTGFRLSVEDDRSDLDGKQRGLGLECRLEIADAEP